MSKPLTRSGVRARPTTVCAGSRRASASTMALPSWPETAVTAMVIASQCGRALLPRRGASVTRHGRISSSGGSGTDRDRFRSTAPPARHTCRGRRPGRALGPDHRPGTGEPATSLFPPVGVVHRRSWQPRRRLRTRGPCRLGRCCTSTQVKCSDSFWNPSSQAHIVVWPSESHHADPEAPAWYPGSDAPTRWQLEGDLLTRTLGSVGARREQDRFDGSPRRIELMRALLSALLLRVVIEVPDAPRSVSQLSQPYLALRAIIEERLYQRPRVADLAREIGYSTRTLDRACQQVSGQTAKQVLDERIAPGSPPPVDSHQPTHLAHRRRPRVPRFVELLQVRQTPPRRPPRSHPRRTEPGTPCRISTLTCPTDTL